MSASAEVTMQAPFIPTPSTAPQDAAATASAPSSQQSAPPSTQGSTSPRQTSHAPPETQQTSVSQPTPQDPSAAPEHSGIPMPALPPVPMLPDIHAQDGAASTGQDAHATQTSTLPHPPTLPAQFFTNIPAPSAVDTQSLLPALGDQHKSNDQQQQQPQQQSSSSSSAQQQQQQGAAGLVNMQYPGGVQFVTHPNLMGVNNVLPPPYDAMAILSETKKKHAKRLSKPAKKERRQRRMFTDEEVENLVKGVEEHGVGKWSTVLAKYGFQGVHLLLSCSCFCCGSHPVLLHLLVVRVFALRTRPRLLAALLPLITHASSVAVWLALSSFEWAFHLVSFLIRYFLLSLSCPCRQPQIVSHSRSS